MSLYRKFVDLGKKVSLFFATGLQNKYYKKLFIKRGKAYIGDRNKIADKAFIKESKKWWKENYGLTINVMWHNFYSIQNGIKDVRYIPENLYYAYIEPYYNNKLFCKAIDDKCYYQERFNGVSHSKAILKNIAGIFYDYEWNIVKLEDAVQYLSNRVDGYVIKESITGCGGNRIIFVEPGQIKSQDEIRLIFDKYKKDYVVEEIVTQCPEMEYFNKSSINTIRFITFMNENGVMILSTCVRIGAKNSRTDNFSTGGIAVGVNEDGIVKDVGYDQKYNLHKIHPNGIAFAGKKIPGFEQAKNFVCNMHKRYGHFRIISWDVVIDKNYEPLLIEFNLTPQSIDLHQINNGPLFGDLTNQVLDEVFK